MKWVLFTFGLGLSIFLSSCTLQHREYNLYQTDPHFSVEPSNHIICLPRGYDGLMCKDIGIPI